MPIQSVNPVTSGQLDLMLQRRRTQAANSPVDAAPNQSASASNAAQTAAPAMEAEIDEASIGIYPPVADARSNEGVAPAPTAKINAIMSDLAQALQSGDLASLRAAAALLQNDLARIS